MANCGYNCDTLGEYDSALTNCAPYRKGGASQFILIGCGVTVTDATDEVEIQALIDAGDAWLVDAVKTGLTAPTPETVAPVTSCGTEIVVNNVYTYNVFDAKVNTTNNTFWRKLRNGFRVGGIIIKVCDTDTLDPMQLYFDAEISFSGGIVLPDTNADVIRFEMVGSWKSTGGEVQDANPIFD